MLSVLHRTAGEARKASIHQIKMCWRGMRGRQKKRRYQVLQWKARNPRCWKNSFDLTPREIQLVSVQAKGRRKFYGGRCCTFVYIHRECMNRLHTNLFPEDLLQHPSGHPTSQLSSARLPHICLFLCLAYSKKQGNAQHNQTYN